MTKFAPFDAADYLEPGAKLRYDTMLKLLHTFGVKLSASPVHE